MSDLQAPQLEFLTPPLFEILEAACERIIPGDDLGPGAKAANAAGYVDRALAGVYADFQDIYEAGLKALDGLSLQRHGLPFARLRASDQDGLLAALEARAIGAGSASWPVFPEPAQFFHILWTHTREGMFCDPSHGGNEGLTGWRLLGFPGVQYEFLAEEQRLSAPVWVEEIGTASRPAPPRRKADE